MTQRRLRLMLDARKMGEGGIGVYVERLIHALADRAELDLTVLTRPAAEEMSALGRTIPERVHTIATPIAPFSWGELFSLGKLVRGFEPDLFHTPHFILPRGLGCPGLITVHDLIPLGPRYPLPKRMLSRVLLQDSLRRAAGVLTVSQATRSQLSEQFGAQISQKLAVIPNVKDPTLTAPRMSTRAKALVAIISTNKPHKGMDDLRAAWRSLPSQSRAEWRLVVVGQGVPRLHAEPSIEYRGAVRREQLLDLIATSAGLVVASLEEGFCLPALEAQLVGTPVITRPVPAVLELLPPRFEGHVVAVDFSVRALQVALHSFISKASVVRNEVSVPMLDTTHLAPFESSTVIDQLLAVYDRYAASGSVGSPLGVAA